MALVDIYNCWSARDGLLKAKFIGAVLTQVFVVINEDGGTANHANRVVWANSMLTGTAAAVEEAAMQNLRYALGTNATLQMQGDSVTDGDILYIVATQLDTFAQGA